MISPFKPILSQSSQPDVQCGTDMTKIAGMLGPSHVYERGIIFSGLQATMLRFGRRGSGPARCSPMKKTPPAPDKSLSWRYKLVELSLL